MKCILNFRQLLGVLAATAISFFSAVEAAKINIHITTGGILFTEFGVPSRLPNYVGSTPAPIVPGTEDVLDCHAIAQENPDYLKTTEAGALCNAVAQIQKHIKDPVELDVEFVFANLVALGAPSALGGALSSTARAEPNQQNKNQFAQSYNAIVNQLKKKNAHDLKNISIVNHLPAYNQLNMILPNDPHYQNNPDYPNNQWKPGGIVLSSAQLKAIGVRPNFNVNEGNPDFPLFFKYTDIDFGFFLSDTQVSGSALTWDLDISDGIGMQGPYSRAVYNSIDFTNPATWPPGFNTLSPSFYADLQGVVMHEFTHGLGFISRIGEISDLGYISLPPPSPGFPKEEQVVTLLDLFRFKNSDAASMKSVNDFRSKPRFWSVDDIAEPYCNADKGTAVVVLDFGKNGPLTAPLANGEYLDPNTGAPIIGKGDGREASHFRSPYNKVPRPASNDCNNPSGSASKALFFFEDPPGRMMRPGQGYHNPYHLTQDDLGVLDVVGWNIDYSGNQSTVLDPYDPFDLNSGLIPQEAFESANGIKLKKGANLNFQ